MDIHSTYFPTTKISQNLKKTYLILYPGCSQSVTIHSKVFDWNKINGIKSGHRMNKEDLSSTLLTQVPCFHIWHYSMCCTPGQHQELVISQAIGGQLQVHTDWPAQLHSKGVFFVKKVNTAIPDNIDEDVKNFVTYGDVHPNVLGRWYFIPLTTIL